MRRFLFTLLVVLLLLPTACAEEAQRVAEGLPALTFTVMDTGRGTGNERRPSLLAVEITSSDGDFCQTITWESNEHPDFERHAPFVRLVDYNFDGFKDLQLLTAQGARNEFYAAALWDAEKGRFQEVLQDSPRLPGGKSANKMGQAEFCNPEFYPDPDNPGFGSVYCVEEDGFRYRTEYVYGWEACYRRETYWVASVYDAGDGMIGESLEQWGTGLSYWWNQTYPEAWYYGDGNMFDKRTEARRLLMLGRGTMRHYSMMVDNVSWVNLRQLDSKDSPSLAQLPRGTTVQVLATGCGEDGGWTLVYCSNDDLGIRPGVDMYHDDRPDGVTGYIWHSYLEPTNLYVANVDWVNVREAADKRSDVVTTLNRGDIVYRCANSRNGWIGVSGWKEVEGFSDTAPFVGYIWHSYLESEPFIP